MTFFDRYAQLCKEKGIDPCGKKAEVFIGVNKTTANKWNINGTTPRGDTVKQIADYFQVSADYLLGRTEDRTDYSAHMEALSQLESDILEAVKKLSETDKQEIMDYILFKSKRGKE